MSAPNKYNDDIVEKICKAYERQNYTVTQICEAVGISDTTYYEWINKKIGFSDKIKRAKDKFTERILSQCESSLIKLIEGFETSEMKTTYVAGENGKEQIREKVVTEKKIAPNLGAIIHYQSNKDPQHWANKQSVEHSGEVGGLVVVVDNEKDKSLIDKIK